jgi:hypothetical protein
MVLNKYKEEAPRAEDKPARELTVSEWLHQMADAGFTGHFTALSNDGRLYKGDLLPADDGKVILKSRRIPSREEARKKLLQLINNKSIV